MFDIQIGDSILIKDPASLGLSRDEELRLCTVVRDCPKGTTYTVEGLNIDHECEKYKLDVTFTDGAGDKVTIPAEFVEVINK